MPSLLPPPARRALLRDRLVAWYREHGRDLPWRRTRDAYAVWVSEAMLQQTRVETVAGYWTRFMGRFPTVAALAEAGEEEVLAAWSGLGYYRRARALHAAARAVVAHHGGELPRTRDALRSLPGVGAYTAGAVLSIAFEASEPLVDGNVERVLARLFELEGARGSRTLAAECWRLAEALVPPAPSAARRGAPTPGEWNQALMELGATVCTPRQPSCGVCPLTHLCRGRASGRAALLPAPRAAPDPIDVALEVYVAPAGAPGTLWLEQREGAGRMSGLWQLPTVELTAAGAEPRLFPAEIAAPPGFTLEPGGELFALRHAITHHRIRARVRRARVSGPAPDRWRAHEPVEASSLALSGMARKVLMRLDSSRGGLFADGEGA